MAKRLVRDESLVVCTLQVNTDLLFNTFINEGQSTPSDSLLTTQDWEEWLIHQRVMLPSRGTPTGWKMGQQELHEIQKVKCKILHLGDNSLTQQYIPWATQLERSFSEKVLEDQVHHDLKCAKKIESGPFQRCPVTGPESVGTK